MMYAIAILDTMYDWRGVTSSAGYTRTAPRYFRINPQNFSGKRLYSLLPPSTQLIVTNACKELLHSAKDHGTPDPKWLFDSLTFLSVRKPDVILICGKVAQSTYKSSGFKTTVTTLEIPHPAARVVWTRSYLDEVRTKIQRSIKL